MPRTKSGDLMPPPPVPSWSGGSNRSGSSSSSSSKVQSKRNSTSKRAGKAPASDEDDDVIAISSDEDERPVKKRGRSRRSLVSFANLTYAGQLNHEMWTDVYGPSSSVRDFLFDSELTMTGRACAWKTAARPAARLVERGAVRRTLRRIPGRSRPSGANA
jgi:hypothetical protein